MKIPINVRSLRENYLYPLSNLGIINMTRSAINKNENLHSPVEDSVFSMFDNDKDLRLKILDYRIYPCKKLLEEEYRIIIEQEDKRGVENSDFFERYKILDIDDKEMTVDQLIDKYLSNPDTCFIKGWPEFDK